MSTDPDHALRPDENQQTKTDKTVALFGAGCAARYYQQMLTKKSYDFVRFSSRMNLFGRAQFEERKVHLLNRVTGGALAKASAIFSSALGEMSRKLSEQAARAEYALITVPPVNGEDVILQMYGDMIVNQMKNLKWVGYLSAVGVYGDCNGEICDEKTPTNPQNERSRARLKAEQKWLSLYEKYNVPVHIFRLAGIYAEERNNIRAVMTGEARSVVKRGHAFNRIHAEDIAGVLSASMLAPAPGEIYNVADNLPATAREVNNYIALLTDSPPPPVLAYDEAKEKISDRMNEFYQENRRVDNGKIKRDLNYQFIYPTYKEGYAALAPVTTSPIVGKIN